MHRLTETILHSIRQSEPHSHDDSLNGVDAALKVIEDKLCRMAFLFRTKKFDCVTPASELLTHISTPPRSQKADEDLGKLLAQMRLTLTGTHGSKSSGTFTHVHSADV